MKAGHVLLPLLMATGLWADTVHLKDGSKVEGTLRRDDGAWVITDPSGKQTRITDDRIQLIEKGSNQTPAEAAMSRLTSLRKSVEALNDLDQIIERYQRLIEQSKAFPQVVQEAQKDLEQWKQRKARGMTKLGGSWMTAEEQSALLEKTVVLIDQARDLVKQGRFRDAEPVVTQLLSVDPKNASGHYLRGVIALKQDQLGVAKKSFEQVRELLPDHAPTLNNLAVILFKQKQPLPALALYDLAMQSSPRSRQILDNVAEALHATPESQRAQVTYKRAQTRFDEQDGELQKELAGKDLHRWGATYVTTAQKAELDKAIVKVKEKLAALVEEYNKLKDRAREIDQAIEVNERSLARIRDDSYRRDASGQMVRLPLPSVYYDIKRDQDKLRAEQDTVLAKMQGFADREARIRQELPVPDFTGNQRPFETEGTPLIAAKTAEPKSPPATRPAAQPAK